MVPQYFMNHDVMLMAYSNELEQSLPCGMKRLFDIVVSATALIILSPLMLALIAWVKSDGGPAFYAHMRIGRNKKPFPCLKFRSMVMNGDEILERYLAENPAARQEWENNRKLLDDPRITKIGKFLRSSSLDELPQLFNVLRGEMSLVGPRPIVGAEMAKYDSDISHYCRVRPGVTGLWQVSGRSDVSYPRRVHMDSWYVCNWSLWHDIAILCKTFPALLNRTGAY
jgi:undecaprenyl-phosphate galactose phosphotransferase